jgi:autotransporter-associated beta strand protein
MSFSRSTALVLLMVSSSLLLCGRALAVPKFQNGFSTGTMTNGDINEASGIIASKLNPNILWTHNDSGGSAEVFAMTTAGANRGTYSVSGASANDWEDIAIGPGPVAGVQYLYIGDIGDNDGDASDVSVYRVAEPTVSDTGSVVNGTLSGTARIRLRYPGGAHDAESLFIDPATRDIYIVSKRVDQPRLYRAAYPQSTSSVTTMELVTTFDWIDWLTAADISPNGNEIIIRGLDEARIYTRPVGGSIGDALNTTPTNVPLVNEGQGEAISFDPNGWGYYTVSEGGDEAVTYYNRLPPPANTVLWDNDGVAAGSRMATGVGTGGMGAWTATNRKWYNGSAEVTWVGGTNAVFWGTAGTVTLTGTQSVGNLTFKSNNYVLTGGGLSLAGPAVTVDSGIAATVNSPVSGGVGLTKLGTGTLNIGAANIYTGVTTIAGGVLNALNATGSATGSGPVTIDAAGQLGGTGIIQGDVTNNGNVSPGMVIGTLSIGGSYTQDVGGKLDITLADLSNDKLAVTGVATLAGTLSVVLSAGFMPVVDDAFEIMTAADFGGTTFTNVMLPSLGSELTWKVNYGATALVLSVVPAVQPGDFNGDGVIDAADFVAWQKLDGSQGGYAAWSSHFGQTSGGGAASNSAPEPSAWPMILIVMSASFRCRRRAVGCNS